MKDIQHFRQLYAYGNMSVSGARYNFTIQASISAVPDNATLYYVAGRPADRISSYSGSQLPFPTESMAFMDTPNVGQTTVHPNGDFSIQVLYPNAYYNNTVWVPPAVYVMYAVNGHKHTDIILLGNAAAYRDLHHPYIRKSADFYYPLSSLPVRSQEEILVNSAYNCASEKSTQAVETAKEFWKLRPAV